MSQFVFLYRGGERPASPEDAQKVMGKWGAWFKELTAKGCLKDPGQPLEPAGKIVKGKTITDGPFVEAKDLVGGFTLIEAKNLDQAAELSLGCPIHARGGTVEVRPVMKMDLEM